jgi:hypothetical protein
MTCNYFFRCDKEFQELLEECKEEFLNFNPKFKGVRLTKNFIAKRALLFYLERSQKL